MSCVISKPEKVSRVANFISRLLNQGYNSFGFEAPRSVFEAFQDCQDKHGYYSDSKIYTALVELNFKAYNGRYDEINEIDEKEFKNPNEDIWEPREKYAQRWHYKILKDLHSVHYQLVEDATDKDPKTKALSELAKTVAMYIATENEIYESFSWF